MYLPSDQHFFLKNSWNKSTLTTSTLFEQGSSEINEDALFLSDDVFGVFDGATGLSQQRYAGGATGGFLAANIGSETFLEAGGEPLQRIVEVNNRISEAQKQEGVGQGQVGRHLLWSTTMAVVRVTKERFEYYQTGDSLIMALHSDGSYSLPVEEVDIDRETLSIMKACSATNDCSQILADQIRKIRLKMNRTYGMLNGEPEALQFVRSGSMDLTGVTDLLLFTDGLFLPKEDPRGRRDWRTFVELYQVGGLHEIRDYVRKQESMDPARTKYPRFKCHDDIAAIAIHLKS